MLNKYINFNNGVIAIIADSDDNKYGLRVLINMHRLSTISNSTDGYWRIKLEKGNYYAYTIKNNRVIYMHDIITGINNKKVEEKFIEFCSKSDKMVDNPYIGHSELIEHKNFNGLVNLDENLYVNDSLISEYNEESYSEYLETIYDKISIDDIYDYSLSEILNSNDNVTKSYALEIFKKNILSLYHDKLFKRLYSEIKDYKKALDAIENKTLKGEMLLNCFSTLSDLGYEYEQIYSEHISNYFFDGHSIMIYPIVKNLKACKEHKCSFTKNKIRKGNYYSSYKLFIEDMTDGSIYVTDTFYIGEDSTINFPTTVNELDEFLYKLSICYECDLDDYYNIACNIQSDTLGIKLLKRKKR